MMGALCASPAFSGDIASFKGRAPSPVISPDGKMLVFYEMERTNLGLAAAGGDGGVVSIRTSPGGEAGSFSPVAMTAPDGVAWSVWEDESRESRDIFLGRVGDGRITDLFKVNEESGFNFSPDLRYDAAGTGYCAWIQSTGTVFRLRVKNMSSGTSWTVRSSPDEMASARLIAGGDGTLLVCWIESRGGRTALYSSSLERTGWSAPREVNPEGPFPQLFPAACLDEGGRPFLAWSAYDGQDYEIYAARREGGGWSVPEQITDNDQADSSPSLALVSAGVPVVAWSKSFSGRTGVFARFRTASGWSPELEICRPWEGLGTAPKITSRGHLLGVTWQMNESVQARLLALEDLIALKVFQGENPSSDGGGDILLDDDKYIGFGDSITYGTIANVGVPELGYLPRLKFLLEADYGPSEMVNEGWPGEITINGMGRMDDVLAAHRAQYLLLMEGTNDISFNEISMEATAFHLRQMILKCRRAGVFPLLATIIPRNDYRWERPFYRNRIYRLNEYIREIAENTKIPLIDMFNIYFNYPADDGGWQSLLSDGVHPSDKGYELMTRSWFEEIKILPFPPAHVSVKRTQERSLVFNRDVNVLAWQPNMKICGPRLFARVTVYRRPAGAAADPFLPVAVLPITEFGNPQKYYDLNVLEKSRYSYIISISRIDGVEGPHSARVED